MSEVEAPPEPKRSRYPSFRLTVFGLLAALLILAIGSGLLLQRAVLHQRLDGEIQSLHEQERAELETLAGGRDPATGEPFGGDVGALLTTFLDRNLPGPGETYLAIVDGEPLRPAPGPVALDEQEHLIAAWSKLDRGRSGTTETEAGPVRWLAVPLLSGEAEQGARPAGVFVVATFVEDLRAEIDDQLRVVAMVSAGILIVALGFAWTLAGRLLRPVRDVQESARNLTDSDLSERIPVSGHGDLADLAHTYNAMLDRLEGAFDGQRRFIDDIGHELRTPITIVAGHLELMGDDPQERAETITLVTDELDRMSRMVDGLLALARAEQPNALVPTETEVDELTIGIFDRCLALGDRPWQIDEVAEGTVIADGAILTQAMLNLARNAVEHTPDGTPIWIGSSLDDGRLTLWVRDGGRGIAEEERANLFTRFARGESGRRLSDGAGLGLAIVRALAESHGGRVAVTSPPGEGAEFTIAVPVEVVALPVAEAGPVGAPSPPVGSAPRPVDDDGLDPTIAFEAGPITGGEAYDPPDPIGADDSTAVIDAPEDRGPTDGSPDREGEP